jgi:Arm DNA-binding domain/Phage integrase central domain
MRVRLTDMVITRTEPPVRGRIELVDTIVPGLVLRVTSDGFRSFAVRYRIDGRQRRLTLGRYPIVSLANARKRGRETLGKVAAGIDPVTEKAEAAEAAQAAARETVETVVRDYVARHLRPRTRTWQKTERRLERDVVARWRNRPLASISRPEVRELLAEIVKRNAPAMANEILCQLRSLYNWASVNDYKTVGNPTLGVDYPHIRKSRERVLTDSEIALAWQAFEVRGYPEGVLGKLLLLSGSRRGEWADAQWSEFDLERAVWTLPRDRAKNNET